MSMELHARTSIKDSTFFFRVRRRGKPPALAPADNVEGTASGDDVAGPNDQTGGSAAAADGNGTSAGEAGAMATESNGGDSEHANGEPGNAAVPSPHQQHQEGTEGDSKRERFLYGFVFCRQRQDASLRRGGEQMSVVVLAEHPLSSVLLPLSAVAGHQYFGAPGRAPLQQVYDEVCRWPPPVAGPQLQLPVGFTALTARLPAWNTLPHPSTVTAAEQYGNNTLPSLRGPSVRSLGPMPSGSSTRRTVTAVSETDSVLGSVATPIRSASGAAASTLSPSSSNASGLIGTAQQQQHQGHVNGSLGANGAAAVGPQALGASPFNVSGGGVQQPQQPEEVVVAPPQQHLLEERRRSSGGGAAEDAAGPASGAAAGPGAVAGASGGPGTALIPGAAGLAGAAGGLPPEGSLQQISGMLADGCAPAAVPVYPVAVPAPGGSPALSQHQRSRSSVLVPSRTSSYAGAIDELMVPSLTSQGVTRMSIGPQFEALAADDWSARGGGQAWRRVASTPQILTNEGGPVSGAFQELDVYTPLSGHLARLWQLWEMTLLGRALMLVAPTPGETAAGVAALVSLVAPLPYSPDFRPYYCIHDIAFSRMASGVLPGPEARDVPTLLGVTNLYFIRALPHWPNVLSIGKRDQGGPGQGAVAAVAPSGSLAASMARANAAVQALRQRTQGASVLMSGHTEALWSSYKPLCRPDQVLLQKLLQPKPGDVKSKVVRMAFVNSDLIRRHFAELTTSFLSSFSRYFEPDADGLVPGWNSEEFLFGLRSGGVPLPQPLLDRVGSAAAAVELYARFTSCLNFAAWFAGRRRHIAHLIAPWPRPRGGSDAGTGDGSGRNTEDGDGAGGTGADRTGGAEDRTGGTAAGDGAATGRGSDGGTGARGGAEGSEAEEEDEGGIASWFKSAAKHLDEVKLIGMFFTVEQQLMDAQVEAAAPDAPDEAAATVSRLQRELAMLFFGAMSEELQLTCVSSPARRELLRSLALTATQAAQVQHLLKMLQQGGK